MGLKIILFVRLNGEKFRGYRRRLKRMVAVHMTSDIRVDPTDCRQSAFDLMRFEIVERELGLSSITGLPVLLSHWLCGVA